MTSVTEYFAQIVMRSGHIKRANSINKTSTTQKL
jgi:hypothetical protein